MSKPSSPTGRLSRRTWFAGAGAVGAAAAAAAVLPSVAPQASAPVAQLPEPPARGGGYQLSEHVARYYRTTRV